MDKKDELKSSERISVKRLCEILTDLTEKNHLLIKSIARPKTLIRALEDLDRMIGMDDLKYSIVEWVQDLIITTTYEESKGTPLDKRFKDQMLHICICGPPGVGKSTAAKILAMIYYGIGIDLFLKSNITNEPSKELNSEDITSIASTTCNLRTAIKNLSNNVGILKSAYTPKPRPPIILKTTPSTEDNSSQNIIKTLWNIHGTTWKDAMDGINKSFDLCNEIASLTNKTHVEKCNDIPFADIPGIPMNTEYVNNKPSPKKIVFTPNVDIKDDPDIDQKEYCVIAGRCEFVGEYQGHTAPKTQKFLEQNRGRVVIIEESYSLYVGDRDVFGAEALTIINRFMDEHADEIIIIFTGYRDEIENSIFTAQPGIPRRIKHHYEISSYTPMNLKDIFMKQLTKIGLQLDNNVNLCKFFKKNIRSFPNFGGDTLKLADFARTSYCNKHFINVYNSASIGEDTPLLDFIIDDEILQEALNRFLTTGSSNKERREFASEHVNIMYT